MFLDGMNPELQKQFQTDCENMSKYFMAGIHKYQSHRLTMDGEAIDGEAVVHVILAGAMFALGITVKDLRARERKKLREFMIEKFDEVLREHGRNG